MISRRLLRIKVLQTVYAYRKDETPDFVNHFKEFEYSITKSYHLYISILQLLVELKHYSNIRIDQIKNRVIKDEKEWQKLMPFANNKVLQQLSDNSQLRSLVLNEKVSWVNQNALIKEIFNSVVGSEMYTSYSESQPEYLDDNKFVRKLLTVFIQECENLYSYIEEQSIYWNDEIEYIISMAEKTIRQFSEKKTEGGEVLPKFKDSEIISFAKILLTETINKWNEFNVYIDSKLHNWEQERVAEIDVIILQMAITEAIIFPEIPIRATLNEYIELAKWYSTDKSNVFINGILHNVFDTLQKQKVIIKKGRGLLS